MSWWALILLVLSVIVIGLSLFGRFGRRSKAPAPQPSPPAARADRDMSPGYGAPAGAPPAPAQMGMPKSAAPNWNAIGAITGVLGLVVSVIGLFKG